LQGHVHELSSFAVDVAILEAGRSGGQMSAAVGYGKERRVNTKTDIERTSRLKILFFKVAALQLLGAIHRPVVI
jgi:hypothetical protein